MGTTSTTRQSAPTRHLTRQPGLARDLLRIKRRASGTLVATALALATVMGLLAIPASADAGPPTPPSKPVYSLTTGYWILHDWGVPGDQAQMTALLTTVCGRMSNDPTALLALDGSLSQRYSSLQFGGLGGDIEAIASDTLCPQYQSGMAQMAWNMGARW